MKPGGPLSRFGGNEAGRSARPSDVRRGAGRWSNQVPICSTPQSHISSLITGMCGKCLESVVGRRRSGRRRFRVLLENVVADSKRP